MEVRRVRMSAGWLVATVLLLAACGDTIHGIEYAEPVVTRFRAQMNTQDFQKIYAETDPQFKAATNQDLGTQLFSAVDRKLGKLKHAERINWNVNTNNGLTLVVLVYASEYERGTATETFTVRVADGEGALAGYNIQSLEMLIR